MALPLPQWVEIGHCTRFCGDGNYPQSCHTRPEGAVLVYAKAACGPGFPIEAPRRHMRLEGGLEGRDEEPKLVEGQTCEIQELRGAVLYIGKPHTGHLWCLLSWEAQYIINRDNLKCTGGDSCEFA